MDHTRQGGKVDDEVTICSVATRVASNVSPGQQQKQAVIDGFSALTVEEQNQAMGKFLLLQRRQAIIDAFSTLPLDQRDQLIADLTALNVTLQGQQPPAAPVGAGDLAPAAVQDQQPGAGNNAPQVAPQQVADPVVQPQAQLQAGGNPGLVHQGGHDFDAEIPHGLHSGSADVSSITDDTGLLGDNNSDNAVVQDVAVGGAGGDDDDGNVLLESSNETESANAATEYSL